MQVSDSNINRQATVEEVVEHLLSPISKWQMDTRQWSRYTFDYDRR